jgi:hypothetical protein
MCPPHPFTTLVRLNFPPSRELPHWVLAKLSLGFKLGRSSSIFIRFTEIGLAILRNYTQGNFEITDIHDKTKGSHFRHLIWMNSDIFVEIGGIFLNLNLYRQNAWSII